MTKPPAKERLARAAFDLFDERGYEQSTVEDITERAGLGRTTFFRYYRAKEDVIFPDHDQWLEQVRQRLSGSSPPAPAPSSDSRHGAFQDGVSHDGVSQHGVHQPSPLAAVCDAVRLVLLNYLAEGDLARRRYALTSKVPALRDREIVSVARYQRLFREFIADWMGDPAEPAPLRAEIMAAAVVAAHNHVLRRWLRGECPDPVREVDAALQRVIGLFPPPAAPPGTGTAAGGERSGATVVAFRTTEDLDTLLPALRHLIEGTTQP